MKRFFQNLSQNKKIWLGLGAAALATVVYFCLPDSCPEAGKRTAFVFVIAAFFWAFEILPLYATSIVVVVLETFLLTKPGGVLGLDKGGYKMFMVPFSSPVIMLFFGGFILAALMHKYHIDRMIASKLINLFGNKPYSILFGFMVTTAFLSMWMSNTATTTMMILMIRPLLSQLEEDDRFRTGLALSIAFAANIGGIGTPVGSPPNAIAVGILAEHEIFIRFLSWMKMAVPLAVLLLFVTSFILFKMFRPKQKEIKFSFYEIAPLDSKGKSVLLIAAMTVLLWLTSEWHRIPDALIALLAVGIFGATGLLEKEDIQKIDWDILVLMWGGLALGIGLSVSGLANWVVQAPIFAQSGFILVLVFCILALVFSTFISNTATANLIIPIAISIPGQSQLVLAVIVALCCSFAMALPVSTPPNAIAFSTNAIKAKHMFVSGIVVSLISILLVLVGYQFVMARVFDF